MNEIVISGYYGFNNSGDDALLLSIIKDFEKKGLKEKIVVLSNNPEETEKIYNVRAINRTSPKEIIKYLSKASLFISGGGTLIQDSTSTKSLFYYLALIRLAKFYKCKVMLYANGIGPVRRFINRKITGHILNGVNTISLRDEMSESELKKLKITKPKIKVTADPVFSLDFDKSIPDILSEYGADGNIMTISVRAPKDDYEDFVKKVARSIDYTIRLYGVTPVFLVLQPRDREISKSIQAKMKGKSFLIDENLSVDQIVSVVSKSVLCMGMRLHMLIYAATQAIPLVGIVYDPKVSGFMDYAKQEYYVNENKFTTDNLTYQIDNCFMIYKENVAQLSEVRQELTKKSKQNIELAIELYNGGKKC